MSSGDPETENAPFGFPSLTLLVVASMVGAGIFTTSGFTLGAVGRPSLVLCCWLIGGLIAICGSVTYGRLSRIMPHSGGEYLFLSRHVSPFAGFLAGWVSLTAGFSGAIATAAVAFEAYALPDIVRPAWLPADSLAIALVVICGVAHRSQKKLGIQFHNVVVSVKSICLLAFVCLGLPHLQQHVDLLNVTLPNSPTGYGLVSAMAVSVVWISLSYAGFNAAIYVASESPDAQKNVPKALLVGTTLVTVLYLILNLIFMTSTDAENLAWQEDIAAVAAEAIGGTSLANLVRVAICLGLFSSVSGMVLSGPRVYSRMADDGIFPSLFKGTQAGISRSIELQTLIAVALILLQRVLVETGILTSSLLGLLIYLGTTLSLTSAACAATLFLPSVRKMNSQSTFSGDIAAAAYVIATTGAVVILMLSHEVNGAPRGLWHLTGAGITFVTGSIVYFVLRSGVRQT